MRNLAIALSLLCLACGSSTYTAVTPAEAPALAPAYDLVVEVQDQRLLGPCEAAAALWAPSAAILCVDGQAPPVAVRAATEDQGCTVPDGYWAYFFPATKSVCAKTKASVCLDVVIPHELGHALGIAHIRNPEALMSNHPTCENTITALDLAAADAALGAL